MSTTFKNTDSPTAILLHAGEGIRFKKMMESFIANLATFIPQVLASQDFKNSIKNVVEDFRNRQKELVNRIKLKSQEEGFSLVQVQVGPFPEAGADSQFPESTHPPGEA